jgi:hypothetical protein
MKAKIKWLAMLSCVVAWNAYGAFTPPTQDQLKAAAEDPPKVVALVQDASIDQAAIVCRDVIIEIVKLGLKPKVRDARIGSVVRNLFSVIPDDQHTNLAIALAKVVAASPTASMTSGIVSAIQQAIVVLGGVDEGNAFGNAYNLAMQTVAGAPGGGKTVPPQPPPPPVALPYEGQRLP